MNELQQRVGRQPSCLVVQVSSRQYVLQFFLTLKTVYDLDNFFTIFDKRNQS